MKPNKALWASLLGLLVTSQLAHADDEMDELLSLSLEELSSLKLTTSTLTEETLRSVPSAMTVYTRDEIRRLGLTELEQLAAFVPGFQTARVDASGIAVSITNRGKPIGDFARSILVLLDGQRINNDMGGAPLFYDSNLSLDNAERVEFIRGPGSALYGTNAMFGVINVITRSERETTVGVGSGVQKYGSAQWRLEGKAGRLELFARGVSSKGRSTTLFDTPSGQENGTYDPRNFQDLSLRASAGEFTLSARNFRRTAEQFYIYGTVSNDKNQRKTNTSNLNLDWLHRLGSSISLKANVWHNRRSSDLFTEVAGMPVFGRTEESEVGSQWLLQQDKGDQRWLLGLEWRQPRTVRNRINDVTTGPENARRILGLFGQYQTAIFRNLDLTAGLRYDRYSDFGMHLSPRLGLVWQVLPRDTLKLLYSEAFRAPGRTETASSYSTATRGNPDLKPETAKTVELAWLHLFNQGLVETTLFHTKAKDAIVGAVMPSLQRTWVNDKARYSGLELEIQYRWTSWQARLAATHLFKVDDPAATQSRSLLSGSLTYLRGPWSAALIGRYHSRMTDPNEQDGNIRTTEYSYMGGAALWGLHLSRKVGQNFEYYLHGENIFNRKILYPADTPSNFVGVPEQGRSIMIGVRWMADR